MPTASNGSRRVVERTHQFHHTGIDDTRTGQARSQRGTLSNDQPTFNWSAVGLAARYDVWVTDLNTAVGGIVGNSTTTSFADTAGLTPGHSFRWWVRADSTNGSAGSWSVPTNFAIAALGTPTPAGPTGTITTNPPTNDWSAVPLAIRKDVWFTDLTTGVAGIIGSSSNTSLVAPASLNIGHSYRWWVRAVSTNGTVGSWSVPTDFVQLLSQSLARHQCLEVLEG